MSRASIRRQLEAIRKLLERGQPEQQPVTFDDLLARCFDGAGNLVAAPAECAALPLDWDSLTRSHRLPRDPATLLVPAAEKLRQLEAAIASLTAAPNGFVSLPAPNADRP